jgi:hypothetical protein
MDAKPHPSRQEMSFLRIAMALGVTTKHEILRSSFPHASGGNPGKHWIPGQARNDKMFSAFVVMSGICEVVLPLSNICYEPFDHI